MAIKDNKNGTIHGKSGTPEHRSFCSMKVRCYQKGSNGYKNYGGKGIKVCDRWMDKRTGFINFLKDMGNKPTPKHTIDRIDNNKDYDPSNCRWATDAEQRRNTERAVLLTFNGKTLNVRQWEKHVGLGIGTIKGRLKAGWSVERAIQTKSNRILLTLGGITDTPVNWGIVTGIPPHILRCRVKTLHWTDEEAITTPVGSSRGCRVNNMNRVL